MPKVSQKDFAILIILGDNRVALKVRREILRHLPREIEKLLRKICLGLVTDKIPVGKSGGALIFLFLTVFFIGKSVLTESKKVSGWIKKTIDYSNNLSEAQRKSLLTTKAAFFFYVEVLPAILKVALDDDEQSDDEQ